MAVDRRHRGRRTLRTRHVQRRGLDGAGGIDGVGHPAPTDVVDDPGSPRDRGRKGCGDRAPGAGSERAVMVSGTTKVNRARSARYLRMTPDDGSRIAAISGLRVTQPRGGSRNWPSLCRTMALTALLSTFSSVQTGRLDTIRRPA